MGGTGGEGWTDERVELLKKLWGDGLSGSQIAIQMREVTRNAVIGKAHPLGLTTSAGKYRQQAGAPPATRPRPKTPSVDGDRRQYNRVSKPHRIYGGDPETSPAQKAQDAIRANLACEPLPEPKGELTATCDLLGLEAHMCKWPIGDPRDPGFGFCGRPGEGYCAPHAKRAFASAATKAWVDTRLAMSTRAQRAA